jgi:hypothetical protein
VVGPAVVGPAVGVAVGVEVEGVRLGVLVLGAVKG